MCMWRNSNENYKYNQMLFFFYSTTDGAIASGHRRRQNRVANVRYGEASAFI